jgi:DNA processing protein
VTVIKLALNNKEYPEQLRHISSSPKYIYYSGKSLTQLMKMPRLAIVGSRSVTPYGRRITSLISSKLAEHGIVIISGLALGVDAIAHKSALEADGITVAVLPSPLNYIYPSSNSNLAKQILDSNGTLVTEYSDSDFSFKSNFVARNRIVAGLAQAILITEAAEKSGSLHTARFALEQGKDVLAIPGNIDSKQSVGTNNLIKSGATPVTSYIDVLHALGLQDHKTPHREVRGRNENEQFVLDLMMKGVIEGEELLSKSNLSINSYNQVITMLEIGGKIRNIGPNQWTIY